MLEKVGDHRSHLPVLQDSSRQVATFLVVPEGCFLEGITAVGLHPFLSI